MFLSKASVEWFRKSMEELRQGGEIRNFCRTFLVGSMVYILQRRGNAHGRFLELYEYGNGGRQTFVILLEGRDGCN
jgi:adenine-specific DNA methylase